MESERKYGMINPPPTGDSNEARPNIQNVRLIDQQISWTNQWSQGKQEKWIIRRAPLSGLKGPSGAMQPPHAAARRLRGPNRIRTNWGESTASVRWWRKGLEIRIHFPDYWIGCSIFVQSILVYYYHHYTFTESHTEQKIDLDVTVATSFTRGLLSSDCLILTEDPFPRIPRKKPGRVHSVTLLLCYFDFDYH